MCRGKKRFGNYFPPTILVWDKGIENIPVRTWYTLYTPHFKVLMHLADSLSTSLMKCKQDFSCKLAVILSAMKLFSWPQADYQHAGHCSSKNLQWIFQRTWAIQFLRDASCRVDNTHLLNPVVDGKTKTLSCRNILLIAICISPYEVQILTS